jgi:hypothetical protein
MSATAAKGETSLCGETSIAMQDVAEQSLVRLHARTKALDPELR